MQCTNIIENKLIELEGGKFQRLSNDLLNRLGYGIVTNSGGKDGTDKTVKGTPDSYILLDDGKFIFVEYTAQQTGVYEKFQRDILKCFDESKTKVPVIKIDKIVIMFNSSLPVGNISSLKGECEKRGVKFEKFDINGIAHLMATRFPFLASDHLGIAIDNGQFLDYKTFVERNDKSILSTPLNLDIIGREDEITEIYDKLDKFDFIVVSGKTGIGKTKLVIEALQRYSTVNKEERQVWFVKDRGQGLYEDLLRYTASGKHIIFVDDINKQTSLTELLDYFSENADRIKIISTARDYALKSSVNTISKYTNIEVYPLEVLSDEAIIELVKSNYGINNQDYHKQIVKLANGNIRLAVMMAIIAVKENTLDSISNIGKLLEQYYSFMAEKLEEYDDEKMLKALAALAFIDKLHLESNESMKVIESITGIDYCDLKDIYNKLYIDEVVDIYEGEIVVLTDQIIAVFIFHYVYEVKRILEYKIVIEKLFPSHKNRIIQNINGVIAYYNNIDFFKESVKQLMLLWKENSDERYRELLLTFWFVRPEDTLVLIDEEISGMSLNNMITEEYYYDRNVNEVNYDQLLSTLGQFSDSENNEIAIALAFKYLMQDNSKIKEVSKMIIEHFGYDIHSYSQGYQLQCKLIELIILSMGAKKDNEVMVQLFCNISTHLLQFNAEYTESTNDRSITIHTIYIQDFGEMTQIRNLIWKTCEEVLRNEHNTFNIIMLLEKYWERGRNSDEISLYELDFNMLEEQIITHLDLSILKNCSVIYNIEKKFMRVLGKGFSLSKYKKSRSYDLYALLKRDAFDISEEWDEGKKILNQMYIEFAQMLSVAQYVEVIDDCIEIDKIDDDKYSNGEVLEVILMNAKRFDVFLNTYIDRDTPFNVKPFILIDKLIKQMGFTEARKYIESKDFSQKEYWRYLFFSYTKDEDITTELCNELLDYFQKTDHLSAGYYRSLDFLEQWNKINDQILRKVIEIIYHKCDENIKKIYFFYMFHDIESTDKLIMHLSGDKELLENVYLYVFKNNEIHDPKGIVCRKIIKGNESVFSKILAIVCSDKSLKSRSNKGSFDYSIFWDQNDEELYESFEYIMSLTDKYSLSMKIDPFLISTGTVNLEDKKKRTVLRYIKKHKEDEARMRRLFYSLTNYDDETRIFYYNQFVKENDDLDSFKALPFSKDCESWSGSEIPSIVKKQTFFIALLENFSSINLLRHRSYLKDRIDGYEKYKKDVRIREMLRGI